MLLMKRFRMDFSTQVFNRLWKTRWKTELCKNLCMEKRGKNPKNVDIVSITVDKPVETVENFMQHPGC